MLEAELDLSKFESGSKNVDCYILQKRQYGAVGHIDSYFIRRSGSRPATHFLVFCFLRIWVRTKDFN
jgi:hypothetical protein